MKFRIKNCTLGMMNKKPTVCFEIYGYDFDDVKSLYHGRNLKGYVIDIFKPRRSKQANKYMWELIDEIADKANLNPNTVYRQAVREAGVWYDGEISTKDFADFCEDWSDKGIGWWVERDIVGEEITSFRAYRGSSTYNSKQMSRLIDNVVDTAKFYDIETLTPAQISQMKEAWSK